MLSRRPELYFFKKRSIGIFCGAGIPGAVWNAENRHILAVTKGGIAMERRTLRDLRPGERAVIAALAGEALTRRRLADMGITPGTPVFLRKTAPFGDPIEIGLRGYELMLRKSEAENILLRETGKGVRP